MNAEPIIVEHLFNAPIDIAWKAITDEKQMRQWLFETIASFQPEVGFETQFDVECEGVIYPHLWKITEVIPGKKIVYDWRYGGYPGGSSVAWELSQIPGGTKLRFTQTGSETFPQDNPIFSRETGVAAWNYLIKESLHNLLATGSFS
ncbi:MAG: SRPBCC domain-containing protein [Acidobacteriota bacterium]